MTAKKTSKTTSKNQKNNKSSAEKVTEETTPSRVKRMLRWSFWLFLKMSFIAVFVLFLYSIYLDGKVRDKFEGQRWQVPVQVFGAIEKYTVGSKLTLTNLRASLSANRYKKVTHVERPGEFALSKSRAIIYRRAFDFGAGVEAPAKLTIDVTNGKIKALYLDDEKVAQLRLEPLLLDRILPESKEDRVLVSLQAVPTKLLDTLLLIEDRNFYFHYGVSPIGILRALYQNLIAGRTVQGGSTLTQQLVKNMFLTRDKTLWRKANEAIMALILEYRYSKDQLLEAYINEVYLGQHYANGIYGFGLAAEFYFGKSIQSLNAEQMAMIIGQVKGPSYYDPWRFPERTIKRRDLVLRLMYQKEILSQQEFEHAVESPLSIRKKRRVKQQKFPAYLQLVKAELSRHLSEYQQQSGVRVFTGFSINHQLALQATINEKLTTLAQESAEQLQVAMVVSDFKSGEIRALVGGKEAGYAGFNRALHAKRPIGSLIKPAVFLAALERYQRFNLATLIEDKEITLSSEDGQAWRPKNYDGKYRGKVHLVDALVSSLNIPTVNLGMQLGLDNVAQAIHLLGYQEDIVTRPSMLLGALNMSPMEINQLYIPIANNGKGEKSHAIDRIVSARGETLWQFEALDQQVISTQAAYLLDFSLNKVTTSGTARSLTWRLKDKVVAGKTGTTNDLRDSWFVGYDNQLLVTTWIGRDDNKPTKLTGSSGALVLFADFMTKTGAISRQANIPASVELVRFDNKNGRPVTQACDNSQLLPAVTTGLLYEADCEEAPLKSKKKSWLEKIFGD
ncbi:MAG: penicillin-binding protein 1B [Colwellia polaris]|mgnify:FL=1|jgi:penicillin-binding protein 1B|uniref:penicillin-binding protein 1B n=1 Tax=Colwellia polaris TaxID=326537 RepID=UPI000A17257A|nr:penicillin-binding protein 1B [Colwellia polaris]|tara:strand:- start:6102 stop:8465 length:2364 start_codon:yes stop_codon:yes gene_type:complete